MQWLFGFTLCVLVAQLCLTFCNPTDYSLPGSSVHGILQVRILEWIAISFSRGSSRPKDQTLVSCIAGRFFPVSCNKRLLWYSSYYSHSTEEWSGLDPYSHSGTQGLQHFQHIVSKVKWVSTRGWGKGTDMEDLRGSFYEFGKWHLALLPTFPWVELSHVSQLT